MKTIISGTVMPKPGSAPVLKIMVASLATAGLISAISVNAQEAQPAPDNGATFNNPMSVIQVTGVRASAQSAEKIKKDSDVIVDSIVADDIGKFPDNNVADTIARVPGVQVLRTSSEANTVLIHGLPGIETLLNGRDYFTTFGRFVQLADIPSAMLQRVDVYKSPSADLVEGGIAGTIDVRTNRPFDFKGFKAVINGELDNEDKSKKTDPNVSTMFSNRWTTPWGQFGALVGLSFFRNHFHEERAFDVAPSPNGPAGDVGPFVMGIEDIPGNRSRSAENLAFQWRPNSSMEFYAEGMSTHYLNKSETDFFVGLPYLGSYVGSTNFPGTNIMQTLHTTNTFTIDSTQALAQDTLTQQGALGGSWRVSPDWKLTTDFARTTSTYKWSNPILDTRTTVPDVSVNTSVGGGGTPSFSYGGTGFSMTDPNNFAINGIFDRYGQDAGSSNAWRFDSIYTADGDGILKEVDSGIRLTDRYAQSIKSFEGESNAAGTIPVTSLPGLNCTTEPLYGNYGLPQWYTPCANYLLNSTASLRNVITGSSAPRALDPGSFFSDEEKTYTAYVSAKLGTQIASMPLDSVVGLRVVKTDGQTVGNSLINGIYIPTPKSNSNTDLLPSINLKLHLRDDLIGRFSASRTIARPGFDQLNPGTAFVNGNGNTVLPTASGGNPDLKPVTADNYDGSLEWYFAPTGLVSGSVFRHNFAGYIANEVNPEVFQGTTWNVTRPFNTDSGHLQGVELNYQQFYDKLPGWMSGLGMQANVTYMAGGLESSVDPYLNGKPFQGMSKVAYTLTGLYEKAGWSGRVAYNWRSRFTDTYNAGTINGNSYDLVVAPISAMDASLAYEIRPGMTLALEGNNLLNFKYNDYFSNQSITPRDTRYYDRTIRLGFRWKM
ncbi:MAG TPA: TonB-dependent receptor [Burkholderiaceae bacterium]